MLHISFPARFVESEKEDRVIVKALDMVGVGSDIYKALTDLENQLEKILMVPIVLEFEAIKDDRILIISNNGEFVKELIWEVSPEIMVGGQERRKRVEEGHLKSSK